MCGPAVQYNLPLTTCVQKFFVSSIDTPVVPPVGLAGVPFHLSRHPATYSTLALFFSVFRHISLWTFRIHSYTLPFSLLWTSCLYLYCRIFYPPVDKCYCRCCSGLSPIRFHDSMLGDSIVIVFLFFILMSTIFVLLSLFPPRLSC